MSYIISSGNKKPQWVPEPKAKKSAQLESLPPTDSVVEEEQDENPFFDSIKNLPGIKEQAVGLGLGEALDAAQKAIDTAKEVAVKEGVIEPGSAAPVSDAAPVAPAPESPIGEAPAVEVPIGEAPKVDEKPAEAPAEDKGGEAPKSEEKKDEAVDAVEIEIPGVVEEKGEVEKEGCGIGCGSSVADGKLMAIAKLSPENRSDLSEYWKTTLGMPADWVESMLKDY